MQNCPAFTIVTEQPATLKPFVEEKVKYKQKWAQNDIGLSVAHYCLQAADLGLGTCIIGMIEEDKVREYFGIEDKIRLVIATGYSADETPRNKARKSLEDVCEVIE